MEFDVEVEVVWELKGTWAFTCFSHWSLECGMDHLCALFSRDGLVFCWKYLNRYRIKARLKKKNRERERRGGSSKVRGYETHSLMLSAWETLRDQTTWDWDGGLGVAPWSLRDWGMDCMAGCSGYSVMSGIWDYVCIQHVFFSACFSETVESKCLGIWAAVSDNKCIVRIFFSKFLETEWPHGWI